MEHTYEWIRKAQEGDKTAKEKLIEENSGLLEKILCLPISGDYPKDATLFPDNKHLVSLNHLSSTMTFFNVDLEKNVLVMHGKEIKVQQPNCVIFHKLQ